jgi:hypothetical protein
MKVSDWERKVHMDIGSLLLMLAVTYAAGAIWYDLLSSQSFEGVSQLSSIWAPQAVPITNLSLEKVVTRPRSDASGW